MGYSPKRLYDGMEKPEIGMLSVAFDSRAVGKMYKIGFCSWLYIVHIYVLCTSLLSLFAIFTLELACGTVLKGDMLRMIQANFGLNRPCGFRGYVDSMKDYE
jgi:hypothetical protein